MTPLLKAPEAAAYLGVSLNYLYCLARAGQVPARRVGRGWRFDAAELAAHGRPARETVEPLREVEPHWTETTTQKARKRVKAATPRIDPYAHLLRAS